MPTFRFGTFESGQYYCGYEKGKKCLIKHYHCKVTIQ